MNKSTKKRKILFGVGISTVIIVLVGSLLWQFHFSPFYHRAIQSTATFIWFIMEMGITFSEYTPAGQLTLVSK